MTAPETNVEKQAKNHVGPLVGIGLAVAFAIILMVVLFASGGEEEGETINGTVVEETGETTAN